MLHVLPKGFVRIRHFGLLAPANVNTRLARCRALLVPPEPKLPIDRPQVHSPIAADSALPPHVTQYQQLTGVDLRRCPVCCQLKVIFLPLAKSARGPP